MRSVARRGRHRLTLAEINSIGAVNDGSQRYCGSASLALPEPARDPLNRLAHVVGRTRIGKADEVAAVERIEVDAGGCGDVGLLQHLPGKVVAVGREVG